MGSNAPRLLAPPCLPRLAILLGGLPYGFCVNLLHIFPTLSVSTSPWCERSWPRQSVFSKVKKGWIGSIGVWHPSGSHSLQLATTTPPSLLPSAPHSLLNCFSSLFRRSLDPLQIVAVGWPINQP
ncbi:hypothetical protein B0T16DRAFT_182990 [Cercophora newfieldiana]|uniref:Uncharacterized protein n=1 Tax=Cercophora newfieldiana TaxID=92897 RepID=A0AA39Y022_9PEZI|nr:hypothetical protein B0T16DRAFT_182990 [Cercophora newfieldiana]